MTSIGIEGGVSCLLFTVVPSMRGGHMEGGLLTGEGVLPSTGTEGVATCSLSILTDCGDVSVDAEVRAEMEWSPSFAESSS